MASMSDVNFAAEFCYWLYVKISYDCSCVERTHFDFDYKFITEHAQFLTSNVICCVARWQLVCDIPDEKTISDAIKT